jgi:hypothetical protein
MGWCQQ